MQTSRTFSKILDALTNNPKRFTAVQSGMRCGKSVAICQILTLIALNKHNKVITCICPTIRHMRTGIFRDFQNIISSDNLEGEVEVNLSNFSIKFLRTNSIIECVAYMEVGSERAKGHQQNISFFNEITESSNYEIYQAVMGRTSEWAIADFNPSCARNWWLESKILVDTINTQKIRVNLYDNQFLEKAQVNQIETMAKYDERFNAIYLQGEYADISELQIITNYDIIPHSEFVEQFDKCSNYAAGLDFGFINSYNAMVEVGTAQGELWVRECMYERGMLNQDIAERILSMDLKRPNLICADNEQKSIAEINKHCQGKARLQPTSKYKGSVLNGINAIKKFKLHIDSSALNLIRDIQSYEWIKDKNTNEILNEPNKKQYDAHCIDSLSYCVTAFFIQNSGFHSRLC